MAFDSNRRALRTSLPLILGGFGLLVLAAALFAIPSADLLQPLSERLRLRLVASVTGALGSGLMLVGAAQIARAKIAGCYSLSLLAFFGLWLGEFTLRIWTLAGPGERFDLLLLRLILAACAMVALSTGMRWIWGDTPRGLLATWRRTRGLFLLQLAVMPALALYGTGAGPATPNAALWLAFAVPYLHLFVSLRRSVRGVSSRESVADFLTS
jgi:hypothetical protein